MVEQDDERYGGIPFADLPIETVDWEHRADHIRTRSLRYGDAQLDLEPEWATEAALDPNRLIGPGSGSSVEVVGSSASAPGREEGASGRVLKVWLVPKGDPLAGDWWGATACDANRRDRRDYEEENGDE